MLGLTVTVALVVGVLAALIASIGLFVRCGSRSRAMAMLPGATPASTSPVLPVKACQSFPDPLMESPHALA
jgi:hypothetical protein